MSDPAFRLNRPLPCTVYIHTCVNTHPSQHSTFSSAACPLQLQMDPAMFLRTVRVIAQTSPGVAPLQRLGKPTFACSLPQHPGPSRKFWGAAMAGGGTRGSSCTLPAARFSCWILGGSCLPCQTTSLSTNISTSSPSLFLPVVLPCGVPPGSEKQLRPSSVGEGHPCMTWEVLEILAQLEGRPGGGLA